MHNNKYTVYEKNSEERTSQQKFLRNVDLFYFLDYLLDFYTWRDPLDFVSKYYI